MIKKTLLASVAMTAVASSALVYASDSVPNVSATQQKQIEQVVHNYLLKNPEVIVESIQVLQQKQMDQTRQTIQKTQQSAPKSADLLFHQAADPVAGNANGKITLVEFFDYQCPHCVKMTPIVDDLIKANPDLRVVFKEFPIRGPASDFAAKAALAAKNQGKYFEFHKALMQDVQQEPLTEDSVLKVAKLVGLSMDQLKADMKSDAIAQQIKNDYKLAQDLQLIGTPAFFIAKSDVKTTSAPTAIAFIPGQVDQEQLKAIIEKISK